jgi:hypothetical protein
LKNSYEIRGEVTAIFVKFKGVEMETLIDTADLPLVSAYPGTWRAMFEPHTGDYRVAGGEETVYLHRYILKPEKNQVVDHDNHKMLDNTRRNIAAVTSKANSWNRKGATKSNSTGIRNVHRKQGTRKYLARLQVDGKETYLGYHDSPEQAQKVVAAFKEERGL